jgi:hypothetical protein
MSKQEADNNKMMEDCMKVMDTSMAKIKEIHEKMHRGGHTRSEVKVVAGPKGGIMRLIFLILMTILVLTTCAPRSALGPAYLIYPEIRSIKIELRSFSFQPNHMLVLQNQAPFTFRLTNTADTPHNFTLLDPRKNVLLKKDLIPNESIAFTIEPLSPGDYLFYCDRFLHRHKGVEGMLMVE